MYLAVLAEFGGKVTGKNRLGFGYAILRLVNYADSHVQV
jgi:hypothetical protein